MRSLSYIIIVPTLN